MKTLVLESLLNRIAGLKACNFVKKKLKHSCFPVNIGKFLRTSFLQNMFGGCLYPWDNVNIYINRDL